MTTTDSEIESVTKPLIDEAALDRLMAQVDAEGLELLGPDGVLTDLTSRIMNRAMEAELADHLGYEAGDPAGSMPCVLCHKRPQAHSKLRRKEGLQSYQHDQ